MIPTGMMKQKMTFTRKVPTGRDDYGQAMLPASTTTLKTLVGFVESSDRHDGMLNSGEGTFERVRIIFPWFTGLLTGDQVLLLDGSVTTLYQIESIEDDRNKHRQLRCWLVKSEEART